VSYEGMNRPDFLFLLILFLLSACSVEQEDPSRVFASSMEVSVEELIEGEVTWAAAMADLDVLAQVDGILYLIDGASRQVDPIFGDPGDVLAAAELSDGSVVISGSEGLFAVQHGELAPSPLSSSLGSVGPSSLLVGEDDDLWLASASGIYLWRSGVLYQLDAAEFGTSNASLAWGPDPNGEGSSSLWVAAEGTLYFLRPQGESFSAEYVRGGETTPAVAVDGHLNVWGVVDGQLHRRDSAGGWDWFELAAPVSSVAGAQGSLSTWLSTEEELWHYGHDGWSSTNQFGRLESVDGAGRALVATETGLERVWAGRPLLLFGHDDGEKLEFAVDLSLVAAPLGVSPRSFSVTVDGVPLPVEEGPVVRLDPIHFSDGPHELIAEAHYRSGVVAEAKLYFTVGDFVAPSWSEDIESIYQNYCTPCHDPGGSAHLMFTAAAWESEIDLILNSVESGSMPLNNDTNPTIDPVSPTEIQLIRAWAAGGFL
jgi:hypothetical protein